MRAAAGQRLKQARSPSVVATDAPAVPLLAALWREQLPPTRVADREVLDHGLSAECGAIRDPTQSLRRFRNVLREATVYLVIFAFILGVSCFVAPRVLDLGADSSPKPVGTYPPLNFSSCSVRAWPDGLRSYACAQPLPGMGLRWHRCC
jgi:hypothetical protein